MDFKNVLTLKFDCLDKGGAVPRAAFTMQRERWVGPTLDTRIPTTVSSDITLSMQEISSAIKTDAGKPFIAELEKGLISLIFD